MAKEQKLGATGKFPQGKLIEKDEGELRFKVGAYEGKVVLDFGKPVAWIGMDPNMAIQLGETLMRRANECKEKSTDSDRGSEGTIDRSGRKEGPAKS